VISRVSVRSEGFAKEVAEKAAFRLAVQTPDGPARRQRHAIYKLPASFFSSPQIITQDEAATDAGG